MKCPSIACLWPFSPPTHRVTAIAALDSPTALFTGGSDGSIVWWPISGAEIRPSALLCGHSAPVSAFAPCSPTADPAVISACSDGVLCIWSRITGRCRRRRRLPPWTGAPFAISPLASSLKHVCVACVSVDAVAVVVVDSQGLNVVRTVFHGNLAIGRPMKSGVVEDGSGNLSVIFVDGTGRSQVLAVAKDSDFGSEASGSLKRIASSDTVNFDGGESSSDVVEPVAVDTRGELVALVLENRIEFRSLASGIPYGEVATEGALLVGGVFLESYDRGGGSGTRCLDDGNANNFVVWSADGAATIYEIVANSSSAWEFDVLCHIPAIPGTAEVQFCELDHCLIRVESICFSVGDSLLWRPHITMWSLTQVESKGNSNSGMNLRKKVAEGGFPGYPIENFSSFSPNKGKDGSAVRLPRNSALDSISLNAIGGEQCFDEEHIVSSSMVLSEDFYAPYAVVYGFYNGEIEVVRFLNFVPQAKSDAESPRCHIDQTVSRQCFAAHTGAILCLAAHRMVTNSVNMRFRRALLSGSMDCTVRIWDMDNGLLIWVLHHHIAPVRQIILPPPWTDRPWNDCFLSVGDDGCVALVSLETMRVERMFPGHPSCPSVVIWDSRRGYVACLCKNASASSDMFSILYLWDLKTGARERIIRGTASHSVFEHFCQHVTKNTITGSIFGGTTSTSSLLPIFNAASFTQSHARKAEKGMAAGRSTNLLDLSSSVAHKSEGKASLLNATYDTSHSLAGHTSERQVKSQLEHLDGKPPISCSCPFPGVASLKFDLASLMSPLDMLKMDKQVKHHAPDHENKIPTLSDESSRVNAERLGTETQLSKELLESCLLRLSLCFLHLWDVDHELDKLLMDKMNVCKPEGFYVTSGMLGDKNALTLMLPGLPSTLQLWKSSPEFCAMRSLTIVSIAQRMISLSHSTSAASSSLAAFYTRNFAEKVPDIKLPSLQLLASFWQDPSEHVRMAARSLFHCAAPRAIPHPLCGEKTVLAEVHSSCIHRMEESNSAGTNDSLKNCLDSNRPAGGPNTNEFEKSSLVAWLESFELQDWISCVGGTSQDAMASHIIVASALAVWYPSIVNKELAKSVVNQLIKLVMSANDRYSSTAAELLAEGMESTWKACMGSEVPHLVEEIFFQIECLSGTPANNALHSPSVTVNIREALVGVLLPSLAMADIPGFLSVIEGQIWATSSDSPVHLVSLKTLIRVVRGAPKPLVPYLDKVINYVLQTMDHGNLVLRKACLNSSMITLKEVTRVFPMVALNETSTRLAVGDAIGDLHNVKIRVYDIESIALIKVLDASGPLGLPSLLGVSDTKITAAITALSFSPDGEGLVAFSEIGLMIRWWSLGTAWWEKLSRSVVPVQCTKLIFVPPEGLSPNSSRSSIMSSISGHEKRANSQDKAGEADDADRLKLLLHNIDLSYRLQWIDGRKVTLTRHGQELGSFQL